MEEYNSTNSGNISCEFTTDQIFESRDDMLDWVRTIGRKNGFVIVIDKSAKKIGNKLHKCTLVCEKGGKYQPPRYLKSGETLKRCTSTKKIGCPFSLRGVPIPPDGILWGITVVCGEHNHAPTQYLKGHEYTSRLTEDEKCIVSKMAEITAPRFILSALKEHNPSNTTGIKSIYNALQSERKAKKGLLSNVQYALSQLIDKLLFSYVPCASGDTSNY
ncbi:hypothetical protein OROHE_019318 [Orobanche hederae]